ncbi:MAG: hypothetical protein ACPG45_07635 [Flavobacteriaceae bacterium]
MKNFIQLAVLLVVFLTFSCSVENVNEQSFQEKMDVENSTSQKLLEVSYKENVKAIEIEWLKEELNVEEIISIANNELIFQVNSNQSIEAITELLLFSDNIISVKEINKALLVAREGDYVKDDENENENEKEEGDDGSDTMKDGYTKGDGTTDSDEE